MCVVRHAAHTRPHVPGEGHVSSKPEVGTSPHHSPHGLLRRTFRFEPLQHVQATQRRGQAGSRPHARPIEWRLHEASRSTIQGHRGAIDVGDHHHLPLGSRPCLLPSASFFEGGFWLGAPRSIRRVLSRLPALRRCRPCCRGSRPRRSRAPRALRRGSGQVARLGESRQSERLRCGSTPPHCTSLEVRLQLEKSAIAHAQSVPSQGPPCVKGQA